MKVDLYLPYFDYNDGLFDVNNDYYSEQDYINAIQKEYDANEGVVNAIKDAKEGRGGLLIGGDGQTYKFAANNTQKEDKVAYSRCDGALYNDEEAKETVDGLISRFAKQEPFVEIVEFDENTSEEEFFTELSVWVREHNSINTYIDFKGDEWVWANEPKRDVRVHFKNNADEDIYAVFENCKIMDIIDGHTLILYIGKMRIIDNFLNINN